MGELEAKAAAQGRTAEEYKALYLQFTEAGARCAALTLEREAVAEKKARLVYAVKDTCEGGPDAKLIVEMVDEKGWKIQSDELQAG